VQRLINILLSLLNLPVEIWVLLLGLVERRPEKASRNGSGWFVRAAGGYLVVCRLAAKYDSVFRVFRRCLAYRMILEGIPKPLGAAYLDAVRMDGAWLLPKLPDFARNDRVGMPFVWRYDVGRFSGATLRYVKVAMDLLNAFGNLEGLRIVEIGGGYGGQCRVLSELVRWHAYTILDLPEVVPLARRYLGAFGTPRVACASVAQVADESEYDVAISNYAFSELDRAAQDVYLRKVLLRSRRGYVTYNRVGSSASNGAYSREEIVRILSSEHRIAIADERPCTDPANFVITWGAAARGPCGGAAPEKAVNRCEGQ
jgi:hypothetical protein